LDRERTDDEGVVDASRSDNGALLGRGSSGMTLSEESLNVVDRVWSVDETSLVREGPSKESVDEISTFACPDSDETTEEGKRGSIRLKRSEPTCSWPFGFRLIAGNDTSGTGVCKELTNRVNESAEMTGSLYPSSVSMTG